MAHHVTALTATAVANNLRYFCNETDDGENDDINVSYEGNDEIESRDVPSSSSVAMDIHTPVNSLLQVMKAPRRSNLGRKRRVTSNPPTEERNIEKPAVVFHHLNLRR